MAAPLALRLMLPLGMMLFVVGCRTSPKGHDAPCVRRPFASFPVGANIIDVPKPSPLQQGESLGLGSAASLRTLRTLEALGFDALAIPVPLHLDNLVSDDVRPGRLLTPAGEARLGSFLDAAHARGFATMLIPHLVLADGSWRGELAPTDPARFFANYRLSLQQLASLGERHCASALSIGVELRSLTRDPHLDGHFTTLVSSARGRFRGLLTYSANWDETETMRHWRLFDVIGVNAFYPLSHHAGATDAELLEGARHVQRALRGLSAEHHRPVWFTELGFKATPGSFVRPWEWPEEVNAIQLPVEEHTQARAFRAVFRAMTESEGVDGVFLWMVPSALEEERGAERYEVPQGFGFLGKSATREVEALIEHRPQRSPPGRYDGER
ncbi:MAG: glycoside hydrolase family 113 [Myxococcota bacterium]